MHEPLLAQAALPAPAVVFGMLMRPYSLGHELCLVREGSPFVSGEKLPALPDLVLATLICCQTWDEFRRMPHDPLARLKMWIWKRRARKLDFLTELAAFCEYRQKGSLEFPVSGVAKVGENRSAPRQPGSPFLLRLHQFVMRLLGLTESQAWDYPLGMAIMRWECYWEQEGGLEVYNSHDAEFDRFVAEQEAKGAAQCPA